MRKLIAKFVNRETISYLIFGVIATIMNIVLFYLFVTVGPMPTALGNILDTIICVLFQYVTNHYWVFHSENKGKAALMEFLQFVGARAVTAVIDEVIMVVGVDVLVANYVAAPKQKLASVAVKVLANVIVIVLNYIFSKLIVFKKK